MWILPHTCGKNQTCVEITTYIAIGDKKFHLSPAFKDLSLHSMLHIFQISNIQKYPRLPPPQPQPQIVYQNLE